MHAQHSLYLPILFLQLDFISAMYSFIDISINCQRYLPTPFVFLDSIKVSYFKTIFQEIEKRHILEMQPYIGLSVSSNLASPNSCLKEHFLFSVRIVFFISAKNFLFSKKSSVKKDVGRLWVCHQPQGTWRPLK